MDAIQKSLLEEVAGLHEIPAGAYNIRANGKSVGRQCSVNVDIVPKTDVSGIDIIIKPNTKNESIHIPVVLSETGLKDLVYNDFYVGENADVTIIAGCGIHNGGDLTSQHDGVHSFHLEKGAKVRYVEKHYGKGDGKGQRILNPVTKIFLGKDSYMEMESVQIKGVDSTKRVTTGVVEDGATLIVKENIMTHGTQYAETEFEVDLKGTNSKADVVSRSVARDESRQMFLSKIIGNNECTGHTECDAIIMDGASVSAIPELTANNVDANLIHEAAIGKIAGEQLIKLMTLGLTEEEAEEEIISGFLK